ncbi:MAG TPA: hypothetical protein VFQ83_07070, partial [Candidatus Udaeobacter sp.]|jgi:hypothetical protein|nr:hypothetical protein [Candidatus Udaeobacter sp.]
MLRKIILVRGLKRVNCYPGQKEEIFALIRLVMGLATNCLSKSNSPYEKSNHTWLGTVGFRLDAGILFQ